MRLDPDCVRDILIAVESVCDMEHYFSSVEDGSLIKGKHSKEKIAYHVRQCDWAGLLYQCSITFDMDFEIADLTPAGHKFLSDIRQNSTWSKIKKISSKVGGVSISTLMQISSSVAAQVIASQLK